MMMFSASSTLPPSRQQGFTLVEMIVVMAITGILGAIVAMFIKAPVQGYVDSARRAEMTDIADTALRRISRDLRLALPNSVRVVVSAGNYYLEFLPTTGGGRYRASQSGGGTSCAAVAGNMEGDALSFASADSCFTVLGEMPAAVAGDQVVVYNLGIMGADAYSGNVASTDNRRAVSAVGATSITLSSASRLPFDSPGHRFQLVSSPVTYVCAPATIGINGTGTLARWWGYPIQAAQPTAQPAGAQLALLADKVSGCSITYDAVSQGMGLVTLWLSITEGGESVNLYNAIHVSNVP